MKTGGLLFCSGVIGTEADGKAPDDIQAEFRSAFEGVKAVLHEEGLTMADVGNMVALQFRLERCPETG